MRNLRPLLYLVAAAAGLFCAQGSASAAALSLDQEVQAGRGFVNAFVAEYGVTENAKYRDMAQETLARLVRACGERPELQWRAVVLKYNARNQIAKNASAWPGGQIITDEEFMRTIDAAGKGDDSRSQALLAGVLAHEISHIIRHDTDVLVPAFLKSPTAPPTDLVLSLKTVNPETRTNADQQRKKETEADRNGAFYLLRAGYPVEAMIDVFRCLVDEKVDEVLFNSELDHARSGERVATVLQVKGQVIEDERLYDEAVNILRIGLGEDMLKLAEANLDQVAARFPRMLPVRHARAVLYHRRFLLRTPVATLKYMPAFSFYRFHSSRSVKVFDSDLEAALQAYESILNDYKEEGWKGLGPTAAAYALALTHAGRMEDARTWADRAVTLAPEDWNSYNTLGIVLLSTGKAPEALIALNKAISLATPAGAEGLVEKPFLLPTLEERALWRYVGAQAPVEFGAALYNLGMALDATGDKVGAARAFSAYLATDSPQTAADQRSDWAQAAIKYLDGSKAPVPPARVAPITGLTAGLPEAEILRKLGTQRAIAPVEPGGEVWRYKEKGCSLYLDGGSLLRAVVLYPPYSAEVAPGVKIGATAAQVEKAWGRPAAPAEASGREAWSYPAQGVTLLFARGALSRVVWSPTPPVGGARVQSSVQVEPGDTAEKVKAALGAPDSGEGDEKQGGAWTYDRGFRVRFNGESKVALVTVTRPSNAQVAGVKLGDSPTRIRQAVGSGFVSADVDNSETYNYPDRGVAFMVRNAEISAIVLFASQATQAPKVESSFPG